VTKGITESALEEIKISEGEERGVRWEEIGREREKGKNMEWKERVEELERRWEMRERGERRRNILVKGLKDGEGGLKERVEKAL